jgi:putative transposase
MKFDPAKHHHRSIRLQGYDYAQAGAYFVTICTQNRECFFGEIVDGEMQLSEIGKVAEECWRAIPNHFSNVALDVFVVMPNHVHGVVMITTVGRGTACRAPTTDRFGHPVANSLPTVIRSFKSAVTRRISTLLNTTGISVWQRNYYEHVIRNEEELLSLRRYIVDNPLQWALDRENPALL